MKYTLNDSNELSTHIVKRPNGYKGYIKFSIGKTTVWTKYSEVERLNKQDALYDSEVMAKEYFINLTQGEK